MVHWVIKGEKKLFQLFCPYESEGEGFESAVVQMAPNDFLTIPIDFVWFIEWL